MAKSKLESKRRVKKKLQIEKCIIIGDARRLAEDLQPIKSIRQLSLEIGVLTKSFKTNNIYFKLYRYEKDGFYNSDEKLIKSICSVLKVTEKELVCNF